MLLRMFNLNINGINQHLMLGRDHMIKFSVQFVCINIFEAITPKRYFLEELLARWKHLGFSANKLSKLSDVSFSL